MVKTMDPKQAGGGAVRPKCVCVCYLGCNAVMKATRPMKDCAPTNDHNAHMCAHGSCCFAFTTVERQHVSTKKDMVHFTGPQRKAACSYLEMRTFSIRSITACAVWNQ